MRAQAFWRAVVADQTDLLGRLIELLDEHEIRYCILGGQGVNAYVEPLVSLDLDIVIATEQLPMAEEVLSREFSVERFPHTLNVSAPGSDLRAQIQTDPRYEAFVDRATVREVLGLRLPVAALEDVLQGKVWAALDPRRRPSKRQKDLADIARLLEAYPDLRSKVPPEILSHLL
ncbi:MAG: nucleotidyl transferase AbiEii/AbiGii toxin family protein [Deltaproteobacteria bacterium]|nr:nucleotidyl transferase AbiEii/AbiGii toxin family protein [Deltaproteobacteria bacterium]